MQILLQNVFTKLLSFYLLYLLYHIYFLCFLRTINREDIYVSIHNSKLSKVGDKMLKLKRRYLHRLRENYLFSN